MNGRSKEAKKSARQEGRPDLFVLDLMHDPYAILAAEEYADACEEE